jgi:hypothetical protein
VELASNANLGGAQKAMSYGAGRRRAEGRVGRHDNAEDQWRRRRLAKGRAGYGADAEDR